LKVEREGRQPVSESQFSQYRRQFREAADNARTERFIMRKKYWDQESVFAHIWNHADADGLWDGSATTLAEEFRVSEDEAHEVLSEICDGGHIEKLVPGTYAIVNWREQDDTHEELTP
jgi:hypothetical protein